MGSYALSTNASSTVNQNLPISQQDVSNPINLVNSSGIKLNSSDLSLSGGSEYSHITNLLDGGAIGKAFDFGTVAIGKLAELTTTLNSQNSENNANAIKSVLSSSSGQAEAVAADWFQNPKIIGAAVAVAVAYLFFKRG